MSDATAADTAPMALIGIWLTEAKCSRLCRTGPCRTGSGGNVVEHHLFRRDALADFALRLLAAGGLERAKAEVVAELLMRTDEIGVTTHGISMVPYYLPELKSGAMTPEGSWEVVSDGGASIVWDGNYLPGHWRWKGVHKGRSGRSRLVPKRAQIEGGVRLPETFEGIDGPPPCLTFERFFRLACRTARIPAPGTGASVLLRSAQALRGGRALDR